MSYGDIEQETIWSSFFEDAPKEKYSVLLHRADGIQGSWLQDCEVIPTRPTEWGAFSLVEVQQDLFTTACMDQEVVKCILLSGDSIPLYSFKNIYDKLTRDEKGYIMQYNSDKFKEREGTVNKAAWPTDKPWSWPIAHQWVILTRDHIYLLQDNWTMLTNVFSPSQVPDEQVYIVFFTGFGALHTFHILRSTRVNWHTKSPSCSILHRSLPLTHHTSDFTPQYVEWIYSEECFFLRKLCKTATVTMNWSAVRPLIPLKGHPISRFGLLGGRRI